MEVDLFRVKDPFENIFNPVEFFGKADFSFYCMDTINQTALENYSYGREHRVISREDYNKLLHFCSEFNRAVFSLEEQRRKGVDVTADFAKAHILGFIIGYDSMEGFGKLHFEKDGIIYHKPHPTTTELFEYAQIREKAKNSLYEMLYGNRTGDLSTGTTYYAIYEEGEHPIREKRLVAGVLFKKSIGVGGTSYGATRGREYIINPIQ